VIIQDGLRRMVGEQENVYYYITLLNENYAHPGLKPGDEQGIVRGLYLLKEGEAGNDTRVQLMGSGSILRESLAAAELLEKDWGVAADVWSVTSFTELRRDGLDCDRWNLLHPGEKPRVPYVTAKLSGHEGPIIASTDYMKLFADQIRAYIPAGRSFSVLGTDGFGRSDFRYKLRSHFEIDRHFIVLSALKSLVAQKKLKPRCLTDAIAKYGVDPDKSNPHYA
jgi:pyruvate dehydrogenase E1 component